MNLTTLEILAQLIKFPTVSRESNLPLISWIRNFLAEFGIDSHLIHNGDGSKSNLLASIGPSEAGGLVLSGHTDVVPVDGQAWSQDPFALTPRGSRLYGRGACDMKGFLAAVLAQVPNWKQSRLRRPIHLMFSYDEEVGCLGVQSMIERAQELIPLPAAVIVGEPTGMVLATEHKGVCLLRTHVKGIEAHSSLTHQGVSAVTLAGELISFLSGLLHKLALHRDVGSAFNPPHTTLSVNQVAGGTAVNIIAADCQFTWDIRAMPGENPNDILQKLSTFAAQRLEELASAGKRCSIETVILADVPSLEADTGAAECLVRAVSGDHGHSMSMPFGTEAGYFQRAGWSTVICGPGDIAQAHKPDEYLERAQLAACEELLERLVFQQSI